MNNGLCGILLACAVASIAGCAAQEGRSQMGAAAPGPAPVPMPHGRMGMGMGTCVPGHGMASASPAQLAQMDQRMRAMQDAHAKMMSAKTPDERRALMAGHRKAMRDGMAAMHATAGAAPCMGPDMMRRHQGMMQMMMQMMAETPGAPAPAPPPK